MSDVIEFAKVLRRNIGSMAIPVSNTKQVATLVRLVGCLDAAIAELESRPRVYEDCVLYAPCGHAAKVRRDEEEGVLHVDEPCPRCESSRDREEAEEALLVKRLREAFGIKESHPAPSPSLDDDLLALRKAWEDEPCANCTRTSTCAGCKFSRALEASLAASQAEVERLR